MGDFSTSISSTQSQIPAFSKDVLRHVKSSQGVGVSGTQSPDASDEDLQRERERIEARNQVTFLSAGRDQDFQAAIKKGEITNKELRDFRDFSSDVRGAYKYSESDQFTPEFSERFLTLCELLNDKDIELDAKVLAIKLFHYHNPRLIGGESSQNKEFTRLNFPLMALISAKNNKLDEFKKELLAQANLSCAALKTSSLCLRAPQESRDEQLKLKLQQHLQERLGIGNQEAKQPLPQLSQHDERAIMSRVNQTASEGKMFNWFTANVMSIDGIAEEYPSVLQANLLHSECQLSGAGQRCILRSRTGFDAFVYDGSERTVTSEDLVNFDISSLPVQLQQAIGTQLITSMRTKEDFLNFYSSFYSKLKDSELKAEFSTTTKIQLQSFEPFDDELAWDVEASDFSVDTLAYHLMTEAAFETKAIDWGSSSLQEQLKFLATFVFSPKLSEERQTNRAEYLKLDWNKFQTQHSLQSIEILDEIKKLDITEQEKDALQLAYGNYCTESLKTKLTEENVAQIASKVSIEHVEKYFGPEARVQNYQVASAAYQNYVKEGVISEAQILEQIEDAKTPQELDFFEQNCCDNFKVIATARRAKVEKFGLNQDSLSLISNLKFLQAIPNEDLQVIFTPSFASKYMLKSAGKLSIDHAKKLLELGANVNVKEIFTGYSVLTKACREDNTELVKYLKSRPELAEAFSEVDSQGNTLIHHCSITGAKETLQVLLSGNSEKASIRNADGLTPAQLAINHGNFPKLVSVFPKLVLQDATESGVCWVKCSHASVYRDSFKMLMSMSLPFLNQLLEREKLNLSPELQQELRELIAYKLKQDAPQRPVANAHFDGAKVSESAKTDLSEGADGIQMKTLRQSGSIKDELDALESSDDSPSFEDRLDITDPTVVNAEGAKETKEQREQRELKQVRMFLRAMPEHIEGYDEYVTEHESSFPVSKEKLDFLNKLQKLGLVDSVQHSSLDGNLLHFAVMRQDIQTIRLLTQPPYSWSLDTKNTEGETAVHLAAKSGNLKFIEALMQLTPEPNLDEKNASGKTAREYLGEVLVNCMVNREYDSVKMLLSSPFNVNVDAKSESTGRSLLHSAIATRDQRLIDLVMLFGPKTDLLAVKDNEGNTPLSTLVAHEGTFKFVLEKYPNQFGLQLNAKGQLSKRNLLLKQHDNMGNDLLMVAVDNANHAAINFFIEQGLVQPAKLCNIVKGTVLDFAVIRGFDEAARKLIPIYKNYEMSAQISDGERSAKLLSQACSTALDKGKVALAEELKQAREEVKAHRKNEAEKKVKTDLKQGFKSDNDGEDLLGDGRATQRINSLLERTDQAPSKIKISSDTSAPTTRFKWLSKVRNWFSSSSKIIVQGEGDIRTKKRERSVEDLKTQLSLASSKEDKQKILKEVKFWQSPVKWIRIRL
ncbi:ankyrin repeat domain-containing protein [Shewanella sp. 202IG2-18]|uniref:ankyrin repeat domain-containing protein n=1 Tax=Parashewanella hymeniacidonis TaxID=2807618 RepID=UPI001960E3A2|nr:ankyrin repeat domain-containing protein [Parashewanella hymeniacidonis]MBM7070709.1 ankyrin repeat domain-containing protein [Parashewanella hymeniacidonis]